MVLEAGSRSRRPEPASARWCRERRRSIPMTPTPSPPSTACRYWSRTRPPSSAAASRGGTWRTTAGTGRPSGAASGERTPAASSAWSTPISGEPLAADEEGLLEVRAAQVGSGTRWIRTTDLARLDADGFLWHPRAGGPGDHPGRLQGAPRRRPRRARAASGASGARRSSSRPGPASRRGARRRRRAAPRCRRGGGGRAPRARRSVARPLRAPRRDPRRRRTLPRTESGKADLAAVRALFDREREAAG